ncbi:uncharacterized membrane protein YgaE (UPF0421/DUF939 family) [Paenibacillus sp. V4I9]|uniref:aromatic acid exporter family protein n=1 Tax=Paenibacillus sp. V4I9 TaxID=3042308 RepID=UPI00278075F3|nr:aromatic acid exporter family protein [Paenibacillus sp. V4I9]MDQ0889817.1 uncharacterized membrane protein YgaE (UPF0421/DUF939 family) [Paenibacillus sp. V4I9]
MKIGFRTIKTAIGVSIAILLAETLHLQYFSSAGILTLLCIQKSRKQSLQAALTRFCACMLGMFFSSAVFSIIGYFPYSFLVLLLLFIPFCVRLRIQEGIASSSVIVMHAYLQEKVGLSFFINEFLVVLIGLGVALLINAYMPSADKQLNACKTEIDWLICTILNEIAAYLKDGYTLWDGKELLQLSNALKKAKALALLDIENSIQQKVGSYYSYFERKQQQYYSLERMLPHVSRITVQMEQGIRIGEFVLELSGHLRNPGQTPSLAGYLHKSLHGIREYHKQLPLPETRHEFENRASLFAVANELDLFVDLS